MGNSRIPLLGNRGLVANYNLKINGDYPHAEAIEKAMEKYKIKKESETTKKENEEMKKKITELEGKNTGKTGATTLAAEQKVLADKAVADKAVADDLAAKEAAAAAIKLKKETDDKIKPKADNKPAGSTVLKVELDAASGEYIAQKKSLIEGKLKSLVAKKTISQEVATAILKSDATSVEAIKILQKALKVGEN
jgi:hypothetical protein